MNPTYKKETLDNGLRIICYPMKGRESAALGIWIKAGSRHEPPELKGIAHFLEHLVFKGTKNYSCHRLKEAIEGVGGSLNGFTSEELTCYVVKIPHRHLDLALDVLSDMVINPLLPQEEIDKERTVIIEEIKMYKDLPQSYVHELLDELLWPNHPLGMPIAGTLDSVERIKRESLSSFRKRYYTPPDIVVSAAGRLNYNALKNKVTAIFSRLQERNINTFPKVKESQAEPKLKLLFKKTEQTHLALGFHGLKRDHYLRHALRLLHIVLGANMSSRLFNEIREEKGLAYDIGTHLKYFQDTGAFIVHAGINNGKIKEAVRLILKELKKTRGSLITTAEFKRAKDFYLGQLALGLEDTINHMLWIGESTAALDKVHFLKDIINEVNRLKRQDIRQVARYIFQEKKLNLALIGPLLKDRKQAIYDQLYLG